METAHIIPAATATTLVVPQAQLWIGPKVQLRAEAEQYLQRLFCNSKDACQVCVACRLITQRQFHALSWSTPEKQYSVDDIDELLARLRFANDPGSMFFFVLEHADALPPACANRLLKSIEEPPAGYYFLLLAERRDMVLPTVRSRCIVRSWHMHEELDVHHQLISCFTTNSMQLNPLTFLTTLDAAELNEQNSSAVLDAIMNYWVTEFKKDNPRAAAIMDTVLHAYTVLPMPGSAKLFWRNLYLQLSHLT